MDKGFYKYAAPAIILYMLSSIILRLWFWLINLLLMFGIRTIQHFSWNRVDAEGNKIKLEIHSSEWWWHVAAIAMLVTLGLLLGYGMSQIPKGSSWENPIPYMDAFTLVASIIMQIYLIKRNVMFHAWAIPYNIINIIKMGSLGQIMTAVRAALTLNTTIFGAIFWQAKYVIKWQLEDNDLEKLKTNE
jgi:nicotinamide riboside transporter PnuC